MARLTQDQVVAGLVARGVPAHVAQGVALNFRDESQFDTGIQELNPHNGRGGYGLAQWTGPRRANLESFAAAQGKPSDDPDLQLDFFMLENTGPEAAAWQKVLASPDASSAAVSFVNNWERPAAQHAAARTAKYQGVGGAGVAPAPTNDDTSPAADGDGAPNQYALQGYEKTQSKNWMQAFGQGLVASAAQPLPQAQRSRAAMPAAVLAPEQQPLAPIAPVDPNRRAQLAQLMAQLNSGLTG